MRRENMSNKKVGAPVLRQLRGGNRHVRRLLFAVVAAAMPVPALAITTNWNGGAGMWSGANWSAGEPSSAEDATFTLGGTASLSAGEVALSVTHNLATIFADDTAVAGNGDLTVGTFTRTNTGQSEFNNVVMSANAVVINNVGSGGNNSILQLRNAGARLTIGAGGLTMTGTIDTLGQRPAQLNTRGSTSATATLLGDVTVNGYGAFGNNTLLLNDIKLNGVRTFTINNAPSGLNPTAATFVVATITSGQFASQGSIRLTDDGATPGGLIKAGVGRMEIQTTSTYTGGTTVNDGTLAAMAAGALGTGNVTVNNTAVLTLESATVSDFINDFAILDLDSTTTVNLNFTGSDTVAGLILNGVAQGTGTYNDANTDGYFTGGGSINVVLVPEPASLSVGVIAGALVLSRRRRRMERVR